MKRYIPKDDCPRCIDLPEGIVVRGHDHRPRNEYDPFVKQGLSVGFTDDQVDFLAEWLEISDGTNENI